MATFQDVLDTMEVLNQELQLQPGEAHSGKGLIALNRSIEHFESLLALVPDVMGSSTGTLTTTPNSETTPLPDGLLRLDALWLLNDEGKPILKLDPIQETGKHAVSVGWPYSIGYPYLISGAPNGYWENGTDIYWSPTPSRLYTVRWYGYQSVGPVEASDPLPFRSICILPLAIFAGEIMKIGVDDSPNDLMGLAQKVFNPTIQTLSAYSRERGKGLEYRYTHDT